MKNKPLTHPNYFSCPCGDCENEFKRQIRDALRAFQDGVREDLRALGLLPQPVPPATQR